MRHLGGLLVLLVLAGIGFAFVRSRWVTQKRQRRAVRRGMRINISADSASDKPTDLTED